MSYKMTFNQLIYKSLFRQINSNLNTEINKYQCAELKCEKQSIHQIKFSINVDYNIIVVLCSCTR